MSLNYNMLQIFSNLWLFIYFNYYNYICDFAQKLLQVFQTVVHD